MHLVDDSFWPLYAMQFMTNKAAQWYATWNEDNEPRPWEEFVIAIKLDFYPPGKNKSNFAYPRNVDASAKRRTSTDDSKPVTSRQKPLTKDEREYLMRRGLCFHCRTESHLSRDCPANPYRKPSVHDSEDSSSHKSTPPPPRGFAPHHEGEEFDDLDNSDTPNEAHLPKRLTSEERQELIRQGVCTRCRTGVHEYRYCPLRILDTNCLRCGGAGHHTEYCHIELEHEFRPLTQLERATLHKRGVCYRCRLHGHTYKTCSYNSIVGH